MNSLNPDVMIKGWCPGALRPMESGDGLIVRLRISAGIVTVALAEQIARWSRRWGNGQIDLTSRANLQMRGLAERHLPDLHDAMAERGLLDATAAAEAVRNVIASPLTGLDPSAVLDVRLLCRRLEERLAGDPSLHRLPAKFGFAIDDGGLLGLEDVAADVGFAARHTADGPAFDVRLAGAPGDRLGPCQPDAVGDVAEALIRMFLRVRTGRWSEIRRMRDLVAACGVEAIGRAAGLVRVDRTAGGSAGRPSGLLGIHRLGSAAFVAAGLPFGRIVAEDLAGVASVAAANGASAVRLTPWRAILVPVPSFSAARAVLAELAAGSFILDDDDPRRRVAACPGAPACARGTTPVRCDATKLADLVAGRPGLGVGLHVSGCEKGCAHARPASVTLVGRNGRYDLVLDGVASGLSIARDLTLEQAAEWVRHVVASQPVASKPVAGQPVPGLMGSAA
jgi:precorrin-3B synthase